MEIKQNVSLQPYNTFGIDVLAKHFVEIKTEQELELLLQQTKNQFPAKMILGGGSNILFTDAVDALIIKNSLRGIKIIKKTEQHTWVQVAAGEVWHEFVLWCIENNLCGVENLSLIPGQVGAAPMQNIGAYGAEVKDVIEQVNAIETETGKKISLTNEQCLFGYRESIFKHALKNKCIITSVVFRLNNFPNFNINYGDIKLMLHEMQVSDLTVKAVSNAVIKIRSSKLPDPKVLGNAGSFFKNPVITSSQFTELKEKFPLMPHYPQPNEKEKIPAGWLIEQCGWKGKQTGNVGAHKTQALVLVNYGGATGSEILEHAHRIQQSVLEKFGIEIFPEVNVF